MANYRPIVTQVGNASADSGVALNKDLTQTSWKLFLLDGTAKFSDTTVHSAAVAVWEANTATGNPDHVTFTDIKGRYGVTVNANTTLTIKVYGQ